MGYRNRVVATVLSASLLLSNANVVFANDSGANHSGWSTSRKVLVSSGILGAGALAVFGIWLSCKPPQKREVKSGDPVIDTNGETEIQNTSRESGRVEVIEGLKEAISYARNKYELLYILNEWELCLVGRSGNSYGDKITELNNRINTITVETFEERKLECGRLLIEWVSQMYLKSYPEIKVGHMSRIGWFEKARKDGRVQKYCQEQQEKERVEREAEEKKAEKEKADREKAEKEKLELERIQRGDLTDEEYEDLLNYYYYDYDIHNKERFAKQQYVHSNTQIIKPPLRVLQKHCKKDTGIHDVLDMIYAVAVTCGKFERVVVIPREFEKDAEKFVKKLRKYSSIKIEIVDENGKSYKKELEEKEEARRKPEELKRVSEGNLTDDEYRTLLFERGEDFEYLAGVIKVLKPSSIILEEIKVDDLVSRIIEIAYLVGDRLTCVIPSAMGDLGKQVIAGFEEKGVKYKKFIKVQDEKGNSYD